MSWEQNVAGRLGITGIRELTAAFYRRMRQDDLVGRMYPDDDWEGSERRLADYLCFRLAGDQLYILKRGHPRLRARHMPFHVGGAERDRWLEIMGAAMDEQGIDGEERAALDQFFAQVADFMRNQPE